MIIMGFFSFKAFPVTHINALLIIIIDSMSMFNFIEKSPNLELI